MTKTQRLVLLISILASFVAFLDGSVVNVGLPAIVREFGGGLAVQQWVADAYLITLGALMVVAGSFSDLFGRRRILTIGLIGFGVASLLCAIAPNAVFLIIARAIQGVAGALLVPSSLALIMTAFDGAGEGKAIGSWTAWTGIAFVVGPLLGGFLVDTTTWRLIFAINLLPIAVTLWLLARLQLAERLHASIKIDTLGAVLSMIGLGGPVFALIEQPHYGWTHPVIVIPLIVGVVALGAFLWWQRRSPHPMVPLSLFNVGNFTYGNLATLAIYAGLSVASFLITVFVQQVGHYSAFVAGMALLPVTILMFIFSSRFGALGAKFGPRLFMTLGPMIAAAGFLYLLMVDSSVQYLLQLFPGIVLFGFGLSMTVAPLTSAVLGSIHGDQVGVASAINNAISRVAGLVAIAAIGLLIGQTITLNGFHKGVIAMAALLFAGGIISAIGIRNPKSKASQ